MKCLVFISIFAGMAFNASSQTTLPVQQQPMAPQVLPGKGLAQYDFFYAGEAKTHSMFIVKGGQIVWSYVDTATTKGEISDAILMTNGNILFAHQFGVTLIDEHKKVLWNYDVPKGREVHTAQPIGKDHIVYVENGGDTGHVVVVNIKTNTIVKAFSIPVGRKSVHGQFSPCKAYQ